MRKFFSIFMIAAIAVLCSCKQISQVIYKNTFTVTFYPGDGGSGVMEAQTFKQDEAQCLTQCSFTPPEGCCFDGWSIANNQQVIYTDKQSITLEKNLILYASWVWKDYLGLPMKEEAIPLYERRQNETSYTNKGNLNIFFPTIYKQRATTNTFVKDIPYINIRNGYFVNMDGYDLTNGEDKIRLTNSSTGAYIEFNGADNKVTIFNYPKFYPSDLSKRYISGGQNYYLKLDTTTIYERAARTIEIKLDDYNFEMLYDSDDFFIPLQLYNDILSDVYVYTGRKIINFNSNDIYNSHADTVASLLYENPRERSPELITYNYNELCLLLDNFYGLKQEKNISNFDDFFYRMNLVDNLLSTDPKIATTAIKEYTEGALGDSHNRYYAASPYVISPASSGGVSSFSFAVPQSSFSILQYWREDEYLKNIRALYPTYFVNDTDSRDYGKSKNVVEVVDNTLYVTIDESIAPSNPAYYNYKDDTSFWNDYDNYAGDTFGIICKAHKMLLAEYDKDSSERTIKNIVIDLSLGGGGSDAAATALLSWVLGEGDYVNCYKNCDAEIGQKYYFDANLDGVFYDRQNGNYYPAAYYNSDCLQYFTKLGTKSIDLNVYVLISSESFSNGGYMAHIFENTGGEVTLIGQKSSGGSCNLRDVCTADGTTFGISACTQAGVYRNDSFVTYENGTRAPLQISPELFYNRAEFSRWLTRYSSLGNTN